MSADASTDEIHPIQNQRSPNRLSSKVTLRAYEVYCRVHGEQSALVDLAGRGCRGGFGTGELIAFLYARSFPKDEWERRVDEAFKGMETVR